MNSGGSDTSFSTALTRCSRSLRLKSKKCSSGCETVCPIVLRGLSDVYGFWNTYWIRRRESLDLRRIPRASGSPPNEKFPTRLVCRPTIVRASVVLPEPDSPTTATQLSAGTFIETLCRTSV